MRRSLWVLAALPALLSCLHDSYAPLNESVVGRYALKTINGERPPVVFSEGRTFTIEILDGSIELRRDSTFRDITDLRRTEGSSTFLTRDTAAGTFSRIGSTIHLSSTRGEEYSMEFDGVSLRQDLAGRILIYRR